MGFGMRSLGFAHRSGVAGGSISRECDLPRLVGPRDEHGRVSKFLDISSMHACTAPGKFTCEIRFGMALTDVLGRVLVIAIACEEKIANARLQLLSFARTASIYSSNAAQLYSFVPTKLPKCFSATHTQSLSEDQRPSDRLHPTSRINCKS